MFEDYIKRQVILRVAVVVPVYKRKKDLNNQETCFFTQLKKVFFNRQIILILPKSILHDWIHENGLTIITFEDFYFLNKITYSKLLCSEFFYKRFNDFDYIQIVQTDCWVFEDKLDHFSFKGFDYIGAPWLVGGFAGKPKNKLWKVGNGGFSLRKVKTFSSILMQINSSPKGLQAVFQDRYNGILKLIKNTGFRNNLRHYLKNAPGEDIFWCIYVPQVFNSNDFKIADLLSAAYYSFEVHPEYLYKEVTRGNLPMGCHNWMNNNPFFWKKYFNSPIK